MDENAIEQSRRPEQPFVTCVAGDGDPYVKIQFSTLPEAQAFHEAMVRTTDESGVRAVFDAALERAGSGVELARQAGVVDEVVYAVCRNRRPITGKLLRFLGFERLPRFTAIRSGVEDGRG